MSLDLSADSISCYHLGNAQRTLDDQTSIDSSPMDFVKGDVEKIRLILKGIYPPIHHQSIDWLIDSVIQWLIERWIDWLIDWLNHYSSVRLIDWLNH